MSYADYCRHRADHDNPGEPGTLQVSLSARRRLIRICDHEGEGICSHCASAAGMERCALCGDLGLRRAMFFDSQGDYSHWYCDRARDERPPRDTDFPYIQRPEGDPDGHPREGDVT